MENGFTAEDSGVANYGGDARINSLTAGFKLCATIRHFLVFLERFSISSVGYSPVQRDLALWDGILDIENRLLCWILDIPCWILDIEFGCGYAAPCPLW